MITKFKVIVPRTYIISGLNREEIVGTFAKKDCRKTNKKEFRVGKVTKRNLLNGKSMIILSTVGLIKK